MKHIKIILTLAVSMLLVSCSKKAPDPGSSDVEELMEDIIYGIAQRSSGSSDEEIREAVELNFVDVIATKVDNEAKRVEFTFSLEVTDNKTGKTRTEFTDGKAIASYDTDGKLHVNILNKEQEPDPSVEMLRRGLGL